MLMLKYPFNPKQYLLTKQQFDIKHCKGNNREKLGLWTNLGCDGIIVKLMWEQFKFRHLSAFNNTFEDTFF